VTGGMQFTGHENFRQRIVSSVLSGKKLRISNIRVDDDHPGIQDFEASFLRLIDAITDGTRIEINETGTVLRLVPGILVGGIGVSHDCGIIRSIGWFIEGILPLACLGKNPIEVAFTGLTNDTLDLSVDTIKGVTIPLLRNFGIDGIRIDIKTRGLSPNGGGKVDFFCPIVREIQPIHVMDMGLIKRIRGNALGSRVSPTILTRVISSARGIFNKYLPDVYIHADQNKGSEGGNSAGYSLSLVAESTTGVLLSVERTAEPGDLPEDIGMEGAILLLEEIRRGGVIDSSHQSLLLQMMILGPEDVCKVRFGKLTEQSINVLRIIKDAFGVVFKIRIDKDTNTTLLSCQGIAYQNIARKVN